MFFATDFWTDLPGSDFLMSVLCSKMRRCLSISHSGANGQITLEGINNNATSWMETQTHESEPLDNGLRNLLSEKYLPSNLQDLRDAVWMHTLDT